MIEPLFGSASPTWSAMPTPGLGWPQLTAPLGGRTMTGTPGFSSPQMSPLTTGPSTGSQPMAFAQPSLMVNPGISLFVPNPFVVGGASPAYLSPELAASSTLRTLLEAVAMRRGQPHGPTNDQECEDFIFDAFELMPAANEVDVRCEGGRITLTGNVHQKRLKHDLGEIAWAIPGVNDVHNNITIVNRRRTRGAGREAETSTSSGRKTA